jgi:hypothetical protein
VLVIRNDDDEFNGWMRGWFVAQGYEVSQLDKSRGVSVFLFRRHERVPAESIPQVGAF